MQFPTLLLLSGAMLPWLLASDYVHSSSAVHQSAGTQEAVQVPAATTSSRQVSSQSLSLDTDVSTSPASKARLPISTDHAAVSGPMDNVIVSASSEASPGMNSERDTLPCDCNHRFFSPTVCHYDEGQSAEGSLVGAMFALHHTFDLASNTCPAGSLQHQDAAIRTHALLYARQKFLDDAEHEQPNVTKMLREKLGVKLSDLLGVKVRDTCASLLLSSSLALQMTAAVTNNMGNTAASHADGAYWSPASSQGSGTGTASPTTAFTDEQSIANSTGNSDSTSAAAAMTSPAMTSSSPATTAAA
eukprot:scpid76838/ scgid23252/ 